MMASIATFTATAALLATQTPQARAAGVTAVNSVPTAIGTQVGYGAGAGLTVSDASIFPGVADPYPSATTVDGLVGTITDVNLSIGQLTHPRPIDLDVMLVAPTGESALVMSDVGGTQPALTGIYLDDEAAASMSETDPLTGAARRPTNADGDDLFLPPAPSSAGRPSALSTFDGLDGNGTWELFVVDDQKSYVGYLTGWSLLITTSTGPGNPSSVMVAGGHGTVMDVDVTLTQLAHDRPSDLDVLLVGPHGQQATLLSDVGGAAPASGVGLVLDDEAASGVGGALLSGRYRPTNVDDGSGQGDDITLPGAPISSGDTSLGAFDGTDPNGQWRLFLSDDLVGKGGELAGWSLTITTTDPSSGPAPTPSPNPTTDVDTLAPAVSASKPSARASGVRRGSDVVAILSEAVRPGTVTSTSAYLVATGSARHVSATATWRSATRRIVIDPRRRLRAATTYRVVITTRVTDLAGNRLDQDADKAGLQRHAWRFTTR